jgi:predicted RNase H-like nuclease (RuvC/YqgF family)
MAHLLPFLSSQHVVLVDSISELQKNNQGLAQEITAQRKEIEALTQALESVVKDIEAAGDLVVSQEAESYATEVKEIEMELAS